MLQEESPCLGRTSVGLRVSGKHRCTNFRPVLKVLKTARMFSSHLSGSPLSTFADVAEGWLGPSCFGFRGDAPADRAEHGIPESDQSMMASQATLAFCSFLQNLQKVDKEVAKQGKSHRARCRDFEEPRVRVRSLPKGRQSLLGPLARDLLGREAQNKIWLRLRDCRSGVVVIWGFHDHGLKCVSPIR